MSSIARGHETNKPHVIFGYDMKLFFFPTYYASQVNPTSIKDDLKF